MIVSNEGPGATDNESIIISDAIPADSSLYVQGANPFTFVDGTITSGLSLDYGGPADTNDDLEFSDTNDTDYIYEPTAGLNGADVTVTDIRITPAGRMSCGDAINALSFTTSFDVIIE